MACAPCLKEFESFKKTESHSNPYLQVILILLEDDKKEFEKRFNLSEHGMDVFTYKEKGITIEDLKAMGISEGIPCSKLYDGRGGHVTNDKMLMSSIIFSYKLGCIATTLKYNPKDYDAHLEWGMRLLSLSRYDDAIAEFELCKKIRPANPDAPIQLSSLYFRTGKYEKALEEIELIIPKTTGQKQMSLKNYLEVMKKEVARINEIKKVEMK
jgi:tetratricopeptide (TPR) repeat protein